VKKIKITKIGFEPAQINNNIIINANKEITFFTNGINIINNYFV
jgi:hypothetical protein